MKRMLAQGEDRASYSAKSPLVAPAHAARRGITRIR
jgi:hypothetical protein